MITDELVLRRGDETVDLDLDGIAQRPDRGFWAVSEGAGSVDEPKPTGEQHEPLDQDDAWGAIVAEIRLPDPVNALQSCKRKNLDRRGRDNERYKHWIEIWR